MQSTARNSRRARQWRQRHEGADMTDQRRRGVRLRVPGLSNFSAVYLWAVFLVLFGYLQGHLFLTVSTTQLVFSQGAVTAVLALAFLTPLTTDTFDLSVGEMMSLTIVLLNYLPQKLDLPIGVIAVGVVLFCGL